MKMLVLFEFFNKRLRGKIDLSFLEGEAGDVIRKEIPSVLGVALGYHGCAIGSSRKRG
jgi:hypothetical protein